VEHRQRKTNNSSDDCHRLAFIFLFNLALTDPTSPASAVQLRPVADRRWWNTLAARRQRLFHNLYRVIWRVPQRRPSPDWSNVSLVFAGVRGRREAPCQTVGDGLVVGWSVGSQSHETISSIRGPSTSPAGTDPCLVGHSAPRPPELANSGHFTRVQPGTVSCFRNEQFPLYLEQLTSTDFADKTSRTRRV